MPFRAESMRTGATPQLGGAAPELLSVTPVGRSRHRTSEGGARKNLSLDSVILD